ncbi:MAG: deoxyribonuclease IV [Nitrospirae bacterium]|nr:deoxyribonuclease IV [Nitrospirota bacterium]
MNLGVHVSIAGKIYEAVDRARELGCSAMQIFSRNPRGWRLSDLDPRDIKEFKRRRKEAKISPLSIHIPYVVNLASPKKYLYRNSIRTYIEDVKEADLLEADYFVTHTGSHMKSGEEAGLKRLSEALNIIISESKPNCLILLENTAGSGYWLGYKFQHHKRIIERVQDKQRIGLCLDTCHAYAAGYNLATEKGLKDTLNELDDLIGLERLRLIHINDCNAPLGSHLDRHEHIGKGGIGEEGFRAILHHPKLKRLPFILETPKKSPQDDPMNLAKVKKIYYEVFV